MCHALGDARARQTLAAAALAGNVGTRMTCSLVTTDGKVPIQVEVSRVDLTSFQTFYTFAVAH